MSARHFFRSEEQELIITAIAEAEKHTSGEIRLHLADRCPGDPVKAAEALFVKLGMHKTAERNGMLIFVAADSHKVAIIGDEGIYKKLGHAFWDEMVQKLIEGFRSDQRGAAVAACIVECGRMLGAHFPFKGDDRNELQNEISY
jgi:uncharacterized membrane protein